MTTDARDKAVEEARRVVDPMVGTSATEDEETEALRLLWQRAQEAEFERLYGKIVARIQADIAGDFDAALDQLEYNAARRAQEAEREENCKAVCERCNPLTRRDPLERVGPAEYREMQWWHFVKIGDYGVWRECHASPIRNRAARAAEEPKA